MILTGNKLRFYLTYQKRQTSEAQPGRYHVGLILIPKNPKNDTRVSMTYHAVNPIDKETLAETWKFETKETEPRTTRLAGCMFLGKVPSRFKVEDINELLSKVHVPSPENAQRTNWRCRHWVIDALALLEAKGVIPKLPGSPEEAWDTGRAFVEAKAGGNPVHGERLYTCDTSGKEIVVVWGHCGER